MNGFNELDRRSLLAAIGAVIFVTAASGVGAPASADAAGTMSGVFSNIDSAVAVGRAYLKQTGAKRDPQWHIRHLYKRGLSLEDGAGKETDRFRSKVSRNVRRDFAAGRIVEVDGWQLSETETSLCAIAALIEGRDAIG